MDHTVNKTRVNHANNTIVSNRTTSRIKESYPKSMQPIASLILKRNVIYWHWETVKTKESIKLKVSAYLHVSLLFVMSKKLMPVTLHLFILYSKICKRMFFLKTDLHTCICVPMDLWNPLTTLSSKRKIIEQSSFIGNIK